VLSCCDAGAGGLCSSVLGCCCDDNGLLLGAEELVTGLSAICTRMAVGVSTEMAVSIAVLVAQSARPRVTEHAFSVTMPPGLDIVAVAKPAPDTRVTVLPLRSSNNQVVRPPSTPEIVPITDCACTLKPGMYKLVTDGESTACADTTKSNPTKIPMNAKNEGISNAAQLAAEVGLK